jgi:hypothetical protein
MVLEDGDEIIVIAEDDNSYHAKQSIHPPGPGKLPIYVLPPAVPEKVTE